MLRLPILVRKAPKADLSAESNDQEVADLFDILFPSSLLTLNCEIRIKAICVAQGFVVKHFLHCSFRCLMDCRMQILTYIAIVIDGGSG